MLQEEASGFMGFLCAATAIMGVGVAYIMWSLNRANRATQVSVAKGEAKRETEWLRQLRSVALTEPLAEKTRPGSFAELVGQEEGLRNLRAALCGPHPQHVLIYGPPGVGKTAAARLVLEEAKKNPLSPFKKSAGFVEVDATVLRFDERGFADPLIGCVHDPIYQGAGRMGMAGVPQPKPGAVTRAHGGILFIDEIGELHPVQMNKLLKVLEDRKVFLESSYYNPDDPKIPQHVHDIFQNGLPADFRLIGATTRSPEEIAPALRSRCVEIFFRPLLPDEVAVIAANAATKLGLALEFAALERIKDYATNGRDAVNMVQLAGSLAITENRSTIDEIDVEWVIASGQYVPRPQWKIPGQPEVGTVLGLGVQGPNLGVVLEVEAVSVPAPPGKGRLTLTGLVEEEEVQLGGRRVRRKSMIKSAAENVLTALRLAAGVAPDDYHIHLNFPGGMPVDGPSAGLAMATAIYSAINGVPVSNKVAMTGELSIHGRVKPVGGVIPKVDAAAQAGVERVLIPAANNHHELLLGRKDIEVVPVRHLNEVLDAALLH
ncbi:MAG: Anti-sigma H sporulation factor, LonB [Clostridia bacterium 62_21]|nr:MAG: Anti-sigma H sporulation factor, LonB [Clostridia bacterium 62_21]